MAGRLWIGLVVLAACGDDDSGGGGGGVFSRASVSLDGVAQSPRYAWARAIRGPAVENNERNLGWEIEFTDEVAPVCNGIAPVRIQVFTVQHLPDATAGVAMLPLGEAIPVDPGILSFPPPATLGEAWLDALVVGGTLSFEVASPTELRGSLDGFAYRDTQQEQTGTPLAMTFDAPAPCP